MKRGGGGVRTPARGAENMSNQCKRFDSIMQMSRSPAPREGASGGGGGRGVLIMFLLNRHLFPPTAAPPRTDPMNNRPGVGGRSGRGRCAGKTIFAKWS